MRRFGDIASHQDRAGQRVDDGDKIGRQLCIDLNAYSFS